MGYVPSLAFPGFAVAFNWSRFTLKRRGVRTQGRVGGDSEVVDKDVPARIRRLLAADEGAAVPCCPGAACAQV